MILVTGARVNAGGAVLAACKARGLAAVGADRSASSDRRFDFSERTTWAPALEGCTQLFLLRPPAISNVAQTLNPFVDFARTRGVGHVVFLSVQGAESRPRIPHYAVEQHLMQASNEWTFLRPGFFAQNFTDAYLRDIRETTGSTCPPVVGPWPSSTSETSAGSRQRFFRAPRLIVGKGIG